MGLHYQSLLLARRLNKYYKLKIAISCFVALHDLIAVAL